MNPLLIEVLKSDWLLHNERLDAYATVILRMLNGDNLVASDENGEDEDSSTRRALNRSYVISRTTVNMDTRYPLHDDQIPEGSIAVIPIRNEIMKYDQACGPRGTMSIIKDIVAADSNSKIKSILLVIDSPGGQVQHTDLLADTIKASKTPVIAYVEGLAASAAYWIASAAGKIIASSDLDRIGSIGTMVFLADLKPYYEEMGVKFHEIYATKSKDKNKDYNDILEGKYDTYRKETLDRINEKFHAAVKANRPNLDESTLTGKVYFAPDAIKLGLIDEIGTMDYALDQADNIVNEEETPTANFNSENMKIKMLAAWTAILAFFSVATEKAEETDLTPEMIGQLNDKLQDLTTKNADLEKSFQDERAAKVQLEEDLATAQSALAETTRQFDELKAKDAGKETGAAKDLDKTEKGEKPEDTYAHNQIADKFAS